MTGRPAAAHVPHEAYNLDTAAARESIRRLAALRPRTVGVGHLGPMTGPDVVAGSRRRRDERGGPRSAPRPCSATASRRRRRCSACTPATSRASPARADAVAFAHTTEEVSAILRTCSEHGVPVIPFGAGSSLEGHVLPVRGGLSLDLTGMDRVLEVNAEDLDCRVQAGVHRIALEKQLGQDGLFFAVDPGADATLGGMAATAASGTRTTRYGTMRENVLGLQAVLADGTVIQTARAPASPRPATTSRGCCSARRARSRSSPS